MSAHAPPAPAARREFRAEHLIAIVAALLVVFAVGAGTSSLPQGQPVGTTCAWHGSRLVASGALINTGMSGAEFRIDAHIRIAGRAHPIHSIAFINSLAGFSAGRWSSSPYGYARKGLIGNAITACTARVRTIPPPSGED